MMTIHPFAESDRGDVKLFVADATLSAEGLLWLRCMVDVRAEEVFLPDAAASERTDGLWQTTCFEIFLRKPGEHGYIEFNFSPSGQWAAYQFTGHRAGGQDLPLASVPETHLDFGEYWLSQESSVQLPPEWAGQTLEANITAVIEGSGGKLGYWALKHAQDKPDFHDPDCFVLALRAGEPV